MIRDLNECAEIREVQARIIMFCRPSPCLSKISAMYTDGHRYFYDGILSENHSCVVSDGMQGYPKHVHKSIPIFSCPPYGQRGRVVVVGDV